MAMELPAANSAGTADTRARERFDALYRQHYSRVLAYALRRAAPDVAHDVVADTFLVAWRRLDKVPTDPLPWLLAVARKTLATHRRSARRRGALGVELEAQAAAESRFADADTSEPTDAISAAVGQLPERDQELLKLVVWDGLSTAEAAAVIGVSHVAARVRLHRIKRRLAAELEADAEVHQSRYTGRLGTREEAR